MAHNGGVGLPQPPIGEDPQGERANSFIYHGEGRKYQTRLKGDMAIREIELVVWFWIFKRGRWLCAIGSDYTLLAEEYRQTLVFHRRSPSSLHTWNRQKLHNKYLRRWKWHLCKLLSAVGDMEIVHLQLIVVTVCEWYRWILCIMMNEIRDTFKFLLKKTRIPRHLQPIFVASVGINLEITQKFYFKISRRHPTQLILRIPNLCSESLTELYNSRKGRRKNFGVLGWTSL